MIEVVDYRDEWPRRFAFLRERYAAALESAGVPYRSVEHVGGTSVPGLASGRREPRPRTSTGTCARRAARPLERILERAGLTSEERAQIRRATDSITVRGASG